MLDYIFSLRLEDVVFYALAAVTVIQLFYYLFFYIRIIPKPKQAEIKTNLPAVSVVICSKDEEDNLREFLPKVLEQDYPNFEVVVVNDCSRDETGTYLASIKSKYPHLKFTTIEETPKFKHGKKLALTVGIKASSNEYLVLTDADCYPASDKWLRLMASRFTEQKKIVLGYGGYEVRPGFLNKLVRYDALTVALNYLTFAKANLPYMGVGRNLAYVKELFVKNKGFSSHYKLQSGDDDLFVNEVATSKNVAVQIDPEAFTHSLPKESFMHWRYQKMRHFTTNHRYRFIHRSLLGLEPLSRILFYIFVILYFAIQSKMYFYYVIGGVAFRQLMFVTVLAFTAHRLKEKGLLPFLLLFDLMLPLLHMYISMSKYVSTQRRR